VDTYLAIASKRDERAYAAAPVPPEVERRILDAGRVSGSSQNTQKWEFVVVADGQQELAGAVYAPQNVSTAALVVAIVGEAGGLDVGRCMQNMMLAAWNDGVASCPNGIADAEKARSILGIRDDEAVAIVLTFGYPARGGDPEGRPADEWLARADRKSLDELVERL